MDYGILVYDVPVSRKSVYNKLRDRLRRISVPMTWSVYLTPYSLRDHALRILKELDEDANTKDRILYRYIKFDPSEQEELDRLVREQFENMVQKTKDNLRQKLGEAEQEYEKDVKVKADVQRGYLSSAIKKIREAKRLATVFEVTSIMEAAFEAFEKLVEVRREKIRDELQKDKEEQETQSSEEA